MGKHKNNYKSKNGRKRQGSPPDHAANNRKGTS